MGGCSSSASVSKSSKIALEPADNLFNTSQCVHSYRPKSDTAKESCKGRKDIPLTGVRLVTLHEADDSKNAVTNTNTNGINSIHERGAKLEELQRNISDVQNQLEENCAKLLNVGVSITPKQTIEEDNNNTKETNVIAGDTDDTQVMSAIEHETLEDFNKTGHVTDGQIKKILNQFKEKLDEEIKLTKTECALASKANALRIKRGCDKISNVEWMNTNGQYSFNARQFLSILSQSYSFLSSIDEIEYLEETRKSIANVVLHAGIVDKICEVVVTIYRKNAVPDWNLSGLWTPLYYALSILWDYTDTSEEWTENVAANEGFMEILHKVLNDISETDGESNSSKSKEEGNDKESIQSSNTPDPGHYGKVAKHKKRHKQESQEVSPFPAGDNQTAGHRQDNMFTEEEKWVLLAALGIVHNISMVDTNIPVLREKLFTDALKPHLNSTNKTYHVAALASLAGIINEEESEIINSNKKVVKHLMKVLRRGLRTRERRYEGWTCRECALTIKMLARNDANKKLLVQLGALPLLKELAQGNTDEQAVASSAIWALSFDEENRKTMLETKGLQIVETLASLKESSNEKIRAAAVGALWNLRDELIKSEKKDYQNIGKNILTVDTIVDRQAKEEILNRGNTEVTPKREGHIMISYQWRDQKTLIDIRNQLHKQGHKVWMDVDNMAGSTLQAMAEAIENAYVVLICYSEKYKISPNCRAEAEYSFQRQKNIVPLRMERDYKPDGWLGILIGTKLFFDFSGKYEFREKFSKLIVELQRLKTALYGETIDGIAPLHVEPTHVYHQADVIDGPSPLNAIPPRSTTSQVDKIKKWTSDDLHNWMLKQNLQKEHFGSLTVDEIVLLINMRREAPESFYRCLEKLYDTNLRIISQLVRALEEAGK